MRGPKACNRIYHQQRIGAAQHAGNSFHVMTHPGRTLRTLHVEDSVLGLELLPDLLWGYRVPVSRADTLHLASVGFSQPLPALAKLTGRDYQNFVPGR